MRIKLICALCLLLLLTGCMAEGFVFDGSITWDSGMADAAAYLGEGAQTEQADMGDYGTAGFVAKDGAACLGLSCGRLIFSFYDDQLTMIAAYFTPEDLNGDLQTVQAKLTETYGTPEEPGGSMTLEDLFGEAMPNAQKHLCDWRPDPNTEISLYDSSAVLYGDSSPSPYARCLSVVNLEAQAEFDEALLAYFDDADD